MNRGFVDVCSTYAEHNMCKKSVADDMGRACVRARDLIHYLIVILYQQFRCPC
jgi:hypothetical protein